MLERKVELQVMDQLEHLAPPGDKVELLEALEADSVEEQTDQQVVKEELLVLEEPVVLLQVEVLHLPEWKQSDF